MSVNQPAEALSMLSKISDPTSQMEAIRGIAVGFAQHDFKAAIDWCTSAPIQESAQAELLNLVFLKGFQLDGDLAMNEIEHLWRQSGNNIGFNVFRSNIGNIISYDPERPFVMLNGKSDLTQQDFDLIGEYARSLAASEPGVSLDILDRALRNSRNGTDEKLKKSLDHAFSIAISKTDPSSLFMHLEKMTNVSSATLSNHVVLERLIDKDPVRLGNILLNNSQDHIINTQMQNYIRQWAIKDAHSAETWVSTNVSNPNEKMRLSETIEIVHARQTPEKIANKMLQSEYSEHNGDLTSIVAEQMALKSPEDASDWAATLEDPALFEHAADKISRIWLRHDSHSASIWISSLPEGSGRDSAIRNLIESIENVDPEAARDWKKLLEK